MEKFGSVCMIWVIDIFSGGSGFGCERMIGEFAFESSVSTVSTGWMMISLMWRIELKMGCNLKKVWELLELMMLWLMIIDEWLGFEGVVLVVAVLLDCLVHKIFVWYLGIFCWNVHL